MNQTQNCLVSAYLDLAELQSMRKKPMYMKDWIARLDDYLLGMFLDSFLYCFDDRIQKLQFLACGAV